MNSRNKQYGRLFFKVLLLSVYFVFFSVQLLLRYTSSHSQESLEVETCRQNSVANSHTGKILALRNESKANKSLSYLNKRFHPKDEVIVPSHDFEFQPFYSEAAVKSYFGEEHIGGIKINTISLRGPPVFA